MKSDHLRLLFLFLFNIINLLQYIVPLVLLNLSQQNRLILGLLHLLFNTLAEHVYFAKLLPSRKFLPENLKKDLNLDHLPFFIDAHAVVLMHEAQNAHCYLD